MFGFDLNQLGSIVGLIGGIAQLASMFRKPKAPPAQAQQQAFADLAKQQPVAPPPASQAAERPDEAARRKGVAAMMPKGPGQALNTLLTGPGGVSPSALTLGRSTLLGA